MAKQKDGAQQEEKPGKNKGEISELYVFLTSLRDGRIFAADDNLNITEDLYYTINKVIRNCNGNSSRDYVISEKDGAVQIEEGTIFIDSVDHETIVEDADAVLEELRKPTEHGTLHFDTSSLELRYHLDQIKANSASKSDIILEICDPYAGTVLRLPFSIKSFMGGNPTLLNSSQKTNLTYRIKGDLTDEDVEHINHMTTVRRNKDVVDVTGRVNYIYDKGCKLIFEKVDNETFEGNLRMIDSLLPEIVAEMLLIRYRFDKKYIADNSAYISKMNPLRYKGSNEFYKVKMHNLLMASFTGMVPGTVWNGTDAVHGGYIVVRKDGSVVCYHLYNRNKFENYLFSRTYFETGSATRHQFAEVERDDKGLIFKLNLAIRMDNSMNKPENQNERESKQSTIGDY